MMNNIETSSLLVRLYADYQRLSGVQDVDYAEAIARAICALSQEVSDEV